MCGEDEMENDNNGIAIVSCNYFKWKAQAQYKETLPTREEAIRYASVHGCNLIVIYDKRTGPKFDVLEDPNLDCTFREHCEFVESEQIEAEVVEHISWRHLFRKRVVDIAEKLGAVEVIPQPKKPMSAARRQALAAK